MCLEKPRSVLPLIPFSIYQSSDNVFGKPRRVLSLSLSLSLSLLLNRVFRKAQEGASSYSLLNNHLQIMYLESPGGCLFLSLSLLNSVFREAQEGASSYSFLNTNLQIRQGPT